MGFLAWLALAGATLLVYAGVTGRSPTATMVALLNGKPLPPRRYAIESFGETVGSVPGAPGSSGPGPVQHVTSDILGAVQGIFKFNGSFIRPVSGPVTSGFGLRWGKAHNGLDIAAPQGTPIKAAANGVVDFAGWNGGYGNMVRVRHEGSPYTTVYAHMAKVGVDKGNGVLAGSIVGTVGTTGESTGPHLHFEIRKNGIPLDPAKMIPRG